MTVYVDALLNHGWRMRGHVVKSCHMIADTLEELHAMARAIGMRREWFQDPEKMQTSIPHYDLTAARRANAIKNGAVELNRADFVKKTRVLRGLSPG